MTPEVKNGCYHYPGTEQQVLQNICLHMESGKILSILGLNGVRETTLLRCMIGVLKWNSGESLLGGTPPRQIPERELWQKIAYVPQAKTSVFSYTAKEMATPGRSAYLKMFELPSAEDEKLALACMESIGILGLKDGQCNEMSGGELQMVLIARVMTSNSAMLILDESESNLDFKNQLTVLNCTQKLSRQCGISAVTNTHYPDYALQIVDDALILNRDGTCVCGESTEVISEESLNRVFSVRMCIRSVEVENEAFHCVISTSSRLAVAQQNQIF